MNTYAPLPERMRPRTLEEYRGQSHLVGYAEDGTPHVLRALIEGDRVPSMILWGPPGTGKTTLAQIIARATESHFVQLSAVGAGVADVRKAVADAQTLGRLGTHTILFIDEVHRFNKSQQDAFLPHVEDGTITFIGATTENPSFEVNNALLSRARTFVLHALTEDEIVEILQEALNDVDRGYGGKSVHIEDDILAYLAHMVQGDARRALSALDTAITLTDLTADKDSATTSVTREQIEQAIQKSTTLYDKDGEEHYNIISAFHKSVRGGDADASLYWLARMLTGGEDPLYIARRLIRIAAEDIGLGNSFALPQATAAYDACRFIGMPECGVCLAQATVYMAKSKKSVDIYHGFNAAMSDAQDEGPLPVPLHLRNAPTNLMKGLGYGKDYAYTPRATEAENDAQTFMPEKLEGNRYLDSKN